MTDNRRVEVSCRLDDRVQVFCMIINGEARINRARLRASDSASIVDQATVSAFKCFDSGPPALAGHCPSACKDKRRAVAGDFVVEWTTVGLQEHILIASSSHNW